MDTITPGLDLALAQRFTRAYDSYSDSEKAQREIACLSSQFPEIWLPSIDGDLLAGRRHWGVLLFSPEDRGMGGYYIDEERVRSYLNDSTTPPHVRDEWNRIIEYWKGRCTHRRLRESLPGALQKAMPVDVDYEESACAFPLYRLSGCEVDYESLIKSGIGGLREQLVKKRSEDVDLDLFDAGIEFLNHLSEICSWYAKTTSTMSLAAPSQKAHYTLYRISSVMETISTSAPKSFHEALQLVWIYSMAADLINFGRMDIYLADLLHQDLETGSMEEEEAISLLMSLYGLINVHCSKFNGRIIIGGLGRPDPEKSDRFSLLAIEASRRLREILPQLTLRCHSGMNEKVHYNALQSIAEGSTYPVLYNDDANVPAIQRAMAIPQKMALQYTPFGCGEYIIEHQSIGTSSGEINCLKILDCTMRNGVDTVSGREVGLPLGSPEKYKDYQSLLEAFKQQLQHFVEVQADHQVLQYAIQSRQCSYTARSILYNDCLERGKPLLEGGVRHKGGTVEVFGHINAADALYAVKTLIFEQKRLSLSQLAGMLDKNFEGYEPERRMLQMLPKFGNDIEEVDSVARDIISHICRLCSEQTERTDLDSYLPVFINNEANSFWGRTTLASADGRRFGEPLCNGIAPSPGNDVKGITAMMRSITSIDPNSHGGAVHNMKLSKRFVTEDRVKFKTLMDAFFNLGGIQAMITVVSREELEDAKAHPQRHRNLLVRVGGFSYRFIELNPDVQDEIILRTLY
jgi:pyruvate-formate lyase